MPFLGVMLPLSLLLWTVRNFGLLERTTVVTISPWSPSLGGVWCLWCWILLPPLRWTWHNFFMFANTILHLSFPSLVYSSMLQMHLLYMVPFMYVRYFFVLFVIPKISFVQLHVHISKTDLWGVVSSAKSVPHLLSHHPCVHLHRTLCLRFSNPLLLCQASISLPYIIVSGS